MPAAAIPAWASSALLPTIGGPLRTGSVFARTSVAAFVSFRAPDDGSGGSSGSADLVALLHPSAVRLPIGIVIDGAPLPEVGTPVLVGEGSVRVGLSSWRPVRWWEPRPQLSGSALVANQRALHRVVSSAPTAAFGLPFADEVAVGEALAGGNAEPAVAVIGYGPGLTPSGDDVVAGAMAVLVLHDRLDEPTQTAICERARTHTTALSGALLDAARRGHMIPQAGHVLTSVAAGASEAEIASRVSALFDVGAHSGHDLAAGMIGALAGLR